MNDSWFLLIAMAFLLGLRHGFDLDHLATIDSMACIVREKRLLARSTGFLFSIGHGLIVILISLIIGSGFKPDYIPQWLEGLGHWISIIFLIALGLMTLWNVARNPSENPLPASLKKYISKALIKNHSNPFLIVIIGALFALSFDTVSQVVLFSLTATAMSGWMFSGLSGIVFMLGMMLSDGLNGLFVSILIRRADATSLFISRLAGFMIALFSLIIGITNLIETI